MSTFRCLCFKQLTPSLAKGHGPITHITHNSFKDFPYATMHSDITNITLIAPLCLPVKLLGNLLLLKQNPPPPPFALCTKQSHTLTRFLFKCYVFRYQINPKLIRVSQEAQTAAVYTDEHHLSAYSWVWYIFNLESPKFKGEICFSVKFHHCQHSAIWLLCSDEAPYMHVKPQMY